MKSTLFLTSALVALSSAATWAQGPQNQQAQGTRPRYGESALGVPPTPEERQLARAADVVLDGLLRKARAAVDADHVKDAIPLFQEAKSAQAKVARYSHIARDPNPIEEESLIAQERYSEAIALIEGDPQQSTFKRAWLTVLYWRVGDDARARDAFQRAFYRGGRLDFSPSDGLGRFLALNGVTDETMQATALLSIGATINGDEVSRVYDQVELLKEAAVLVPNDPYITYKIGETYCNGHQYKEALTYLQEAKPKMSRYIELHRCEGLVFECKRYLAAKTDGG